MTAAMFRGSTPSRLAVDRLKIPHLELHDLVERGDFRSHPHVVRQNDAAAVFNLFSFFMARDRQDHLARVVAGNLLALSGFLHAGFELDLLA